MFRKKMRWKNFDYSNAGSYFITICTINKNKLLSNFIADKSFKPILVLSDCGKIVDKNINNIRFCYNNVYIDNYVIMPNHIHLLITSNTNIYIPNLIRTFKTLSSKELGKSIFQRSYHDHVIRNKQEYTQIWQYITDNPINWNKDVYFS